ncbi:hypothetical protein [Nitratireductor sp. GCM10026969]|uniref:hypothetical protein n=1 Tax=Nitratireductor sp. GCM10026969 TaxID=3252645 RepID=UPI00361BCF0C
MKVTMRLTLDGLVRAMRMKVHQVADAVEGGAADRNVNAMDPSREDAARKGGGRHDSRHA